MTADFFQQLELPSSIARTPKNAGTPFTMLDNRLVHVNPKLAGLKRGDKEIHAILMSLKDGWDFKHVADWLAKRQGFSRRTAFRILNRLIDAGLMARTEDEDTGRWGYQVFEVPCENRPTGAAARERHLISGRKARHQYYLSGPRAPKKCRGLLEVGNPGPAFLGPGKGVPNLAHRETTMGSVLRSSEHSVTPPPPVGGPGSLDDSRVRCNDCKPAHRDKPARGAKRQKGRSSPGRPHNARQMKPKKSPPQFPQLSRLYVNLGNYRATPDAEEFMQNLATRLTPARRALRNLPEPNTQPWLDALMANPLISVAQEVYGYENWTSQGLRSFLKKLGKGLSVYDLLLCWLGMNGRWSSDTVWDMRQRLTKRRSPVEPDYRRSQVCPDLIMEIHTWHQHVDGVRESLAEQCTKSVVELLAGVDLDDPESIKTHPMVWTAILASPAPPEEFIDADVVELARQTLVPVDREEFVAWIDSQSCRMPCRWNGRFCVGELETLVGRGICKVVGEWYEFDMVNPSGRRGSRGDYRHATEARVATISHFD